MIVLCYIDLEWLSYGLLNTVPNEPIEPPLSNFGLLGVLLPVSLGIIGATYFSVLGFITGGSGLTLFT
jgi:hypothetical protein